jgi:hypothetical protein
MTCWYSIFICDLEIFFIIFIKKKKLFFGNKNNESNWTTLKCLL